LSGFQKLFSKQQFGALNGCSLPLFSSQATVTSGLLERVESRLQQNAKNPVDGFGAHPYMAPHSGGRGLHRKVSVRFVPLLSRYNRCPEPIEPGEEARRLFDIVGFR
jgi:hypothetical protein